MKQYRPFLLNEFRRCYGLDFLDVKTTKQWYEMFKEIGSIGELPSSDKLTASKANMDVVRRSIESYKMYSSIEHIQDS